MSWGLPPTYKESLYFKDIGHQELIGKTSAVLAAENYIIKSQSPYTLVATKKAGFTFYSFLLFTRPLLYLSVLADEDGKLTLEMEFRHSSGYASTFNDLGKCRKHVKELLLKIQQAI